MRLDDTKIIVTGAAGGMGRHFALRLAEAGARVAAGDVNLDGLETLSKESEIRGHSIAVRRLDVSDEQETASFVEWAHEALRGLNGLVNNAGILRDALLVKKDRTTGEVRTLSLEDWQQVIDVNLTGATLMVRDVVAKMVAEGHRGVVINMSSASRHGNRGQSNYSAAKAALAANTKTWALEWARFGIRCCAIAPGMVETPMTQGMNQRARDALVRSIPVGRIAKPEDIWLAVKFAIECDFFNARTVDVDGGLSF